MFVNKKTLLVVTIFAAITSSCFGAAQFQQPVAVIEKHRTLPCSQWLNTDVFTIKEQVANLNNSIDEAGLVKVFPNFKNKAKGTYNGVSDIVYVTQFKGTAYAFLVQACGNDPAKFDGSTWSFPGGRNDADLPAIAASREGCEETALTFAVPTKDLTLRSQLPH